MREAEAKQLEQELKSFKGYSAKTSKQPSTTRGYSPEIAKLFGSRDIAIFLNQMAYRHSQSGNGFYKYVDASPGANGYREGDSWCEELVMSRYEFKKCRDAVSTRVYSKKQAEELADSGTSIDSLVTYYICKSNRNITYWYFNEKLYKKLYAFANANTQKIVEVEDKAEVKKTNLGRSEKNQPHISENNKEYNNMNIEDFDSMFVEAEAKPIRKPSSTAKREKTKAKAAKPTRKLTQEQLEIVKQKKYGDPMPIDFSVKQGIIDQVVESGFNYDDVITEARLFMHHYKNEHPDKTCKDWDARFRDFWMPNSVKFKKKKESYRKSNKSSANEERVKGLQRIAESSVFDRVGTTDLNELGDNLRDYYKEVYGDFDS